MIGYEVLLLLLDAEARRHREHADVVRHARILRRDEIRKGTVGAHHAVDDLPHALLAHAVPGQRDLRSGFVGVELDVVVVHRVRGQKLITPFAVSQRPWIIR